ncbi:MAG: hypothetical protein ACYTBP_13915, partial [Planctomycetota bacterium]
QRHFGGRPECYDRQSVNGYCPTALKRRILRAVTGQILTKKDNKNGTEINEAVLIPYILTTSEN